jgi:NADH-quinone oxidoreductase subunit G
LFFQYSNIPVFQYSLLLGRVMPKLKIDGLEIEVPKGTKVIEAAERLGIIIPRFCYHPSLGAIGACRMCAVMFLEGPVKGIQMSCMTDAQDGMVVSTTDEEAVDFRKHVIEWLMMNHPLDCPVCDEGGHCLLQDMTVSGGHGIRRYLGKKRTFYDQYLGPFVQHEMNRCIHCWRCRRFYQEFAGYRDLGAMQIASHTYFGRFKDGPLESPFSGNLIDICPTGVYTDKPSRFTGRRWDFERHPSLCIHCSLGCNIVASSRYRKLARLEARYSEPVNGYFICDRGRYGFYYTSHPDRPRRPRLGAEEVTWEKAAQAAVEKLSEIVKREGPQSVACVGSTRSSLENQAMLDRFCELQGWQEPRFFETSSVARRIKKAVSTLDAGSATSLREVEKADFILAVGADPVNEAPMLALSMRQASRNGATVVLLDPRPVFLPFEFEHLPIPPADLALYLEALIKGTIERPAVEKIGQEALQFYDSFPEEYAACRDQVSGLSRKLRESRHPVIVCGTNIVDEETIDLVASSLRLLQDTGTEARLFYLMPGANAFGAALLSGHEDSFSGILESIEKGSIKALILVESDPFWFFPDQERLKKAFGDLDLLLVMDYLPSSTVRSATLFFPTQTLFETESGFLNQEGRLQFTTPGYSGGIPIEQISGGSHPPRVFEHEIPGGKSRPAWQILDQLCGSMTSPEKRIPPITRDQLWRWIREKHPAFASLSPGNGESEGDRVRLEDGRRYPPLKTARRDGPLTEESLALLAVDRTFGTEELSSYSKCIQQAEERPRLFMHVSDAKRIPIAYGDKIRLSLAGSLLELEASVVENMAPGVIVLPLHRPLPWQNLKTIPLKVTLDQISK